MARLDITGQRFGKLVALHFDHARMRAAYWRCQCDCGSITVVRAAVLRNGTTVSCGCHRASLIARRSKTHCASNTRLYRVWQHLRSRCKQPSDPAYPRYGGRGIAVCQEWDKDFRQFERWALAKGYRQGLSIDRIDNDGPYAPENCRWTTSLVQARNRSYVSSIRYRGKVACLAEHAADAGIKYGTAFRRLTVGWPLEKVFAPSDFRRSLS